jgi:pyruvate ferredoxin oxidoreductase gamma subunit
MKQKKLNIRWHSRAGQGAVTAANFFAEGMNKMGYKTQSFPNYGAEKRGAPVVVYNRVVQTNNILDDPAHLRHLDLVILLDPTLVGNELTYDNILDGLSPNGILIINTSKITSSAFNKQFSGKIYHLNATRIALETIGRNVPNVSMVGGITNILKLDEKKMKIILKEHLSNFFPKKIVDKNLEGFSQGFSQIKKIK